MGRGRGAPESRAACQVPAVSPLPLPSQNPQDDIGEVRAVTAPFVQMRKLRPGGRVYSPKATQYGPLDLNHFPMPPPPEVFAEHR